MNSPFKLALLQSKSERKGRSDNDGLKFIIVWGGKTDATTYECIRDDDTIRTLVQFSFLNLSNWPEHLQMSKDYGYVENIVLFLYIENVYASNITTYLILHVIWNH